MVGLNISEAWQEGGTHKVRARRVELVWILEELARWEPLSPGEADLSRAGELKGPV